MNIQDKPHKIDKIPHKNSNKANMFSSSSSKMVALLDSCKFWLSRSVDVGRLCVICSSSKFHCRLMMMRVFATMFPSISSTYSVKTRCMDQNLNHLGTVKDMLLCYLHWIESMHL